MPSIHVHYRHYNDVLDLIKSVRGRDHYNIVDIRDLYDHTEYGIISFDFKTAEDAMLFKLKYDGEYRPHG